MQIVIMEYVARCTNLSIDSHPGYILLSWFQSTCLNGIHLLKLVSKIPLIATVNLVPCEFCFLGTTTCNLNVQALIFLESTYQKGEEFISKMNKMKEIMKGLTDG